MLIKCKFNGINKNNFVIEIFQSVVKILIKSAKKKKFNLKFNVYISITP